MWQYSIERLLTTACCAVMTVVRFSPELSSVSSYTASINFDSALEGALFDGIDGIALDGASALVGGQFRDITCARVFRWTEGISFSLVII